MCHPSTKRKCLRCQKNDSISSSPLVSELMEDGAVMVRDDLDVLLQVASHLAWRALFVVLSIRVSGTHQD